MSFLCFAVILSLSPGHLILDKFITKSLILEAEGLNRAQLSSHSTDFTYKGVFVITTSIIPFTIPGLVHGSTVLSPLSIGFISSPSGEAVAFGSRIRPYPVAFSSDVRIAEPYIIDIAGMKNNIYIVA